jgi:hypothetical protein
VLVLSTTTVGIRRPTQDDDPYETPATPTTIATGVPAHISAPSGADARVGGKEELVDAVLLVDTTTPLQRIDLIDDELTGETYSVTWTRQRTGLGLDHQKAGLVAVKGGASG